MVDPNIKDSLDKAFRTVRILWVAIMASLGAMLIVAHVAADQAGQNPEAQAILRYPLMAVAIVILLAVPVVRRFFLKTGSQAAASMNDPAAKFNALAVRYTTAVIVSMALCESVTVFGLVLYFLGGDMPTFYIFLAASVVGMYAYRPRKEALEELAKTAPGQTPDL